MEWGFGSPSRIGTGRASLTITVTKVNPSGGGSGERIRFNIPTAAGGSGSNVDVDTGNVPASNYPGDPDAVIVGWVTASGTTTEQARRFAVVINYLVKGVTAVAVGSKIEVTIDKQGTDGNSATAAYTAAGSEAMLNIEGGTSANFAGGTATFIQHAPTTTYYDWGFGSPTPALPSGTAIALSTSNFDTAFGSPYFVYESAVKIVDDFDPGNALSALAYPLPDNGGIAVALTGEIPYITDIIEDPDTPGTQIKILLPLKLRVFGANNTFFDKNGKSVGAESSGDYVYSCTPGAGNNIRPLHKVEGLPLGQVAYFALPPLPPGTYGVKMYFGQGFAQTKTINNAFRVIRRNRSKSTYRMRTNVPELLKTGPRYVEAEEFLKGGFS